MKIILVDAYNTFVTENGINQKMFKLLETFSNKKIILTNADEEKQKELGLVNLPYEMFTQNFNPMKSDSKYYQNFFEKYSLNSSEVIYFEHNLEAVESARKTGIITFHYDKNKKDLENLEKFLRTNL